MSASPKLQISVLGELSVAREGRALPLPHSKKTRALLAYLAVVRRPQRRDHLCDMLWDAPDDPRASLRWSLHKIRQITNTDGAECLRADHERVFFDPDCFELDFRRIEDVSSGRLETLDSSALQELAATAGADFLEGLCLPRCPTFEAWRLYHVDEVVRLRTRVREALARRSRAGAMRGEAAAELGRDAISGKPALPASDGSGQQSQEIRFCRTSDGVRIAYAACGHGPPLVRAAHWMSHLQYDWESPVWRHWIEALSATTTLIRYDERGNGLSDWEVADITFEAMVADLESVVDAAGLERFSLLGVSQSCAVAVAYAVKHPARVRNLVLYGGFVKGWHKRGDPHEIATHEALTTLIREGWGKDNPVFRQMFTLMFIPDASNEQMAWFNELQHKTVSPANAARLLDAFGQIDVSDLLGRVRVPTMVLHARRDAAVPFDAGREFATGISGARFVDLDSANHILLSHEPAFAAFRRELTSFTAERPQPR